MPAGRITKYDPDIYPAWAWHLATNGKKDDEIADEMDIAPSTFYEWKKIHKEFSEAVKKGKAPADATVKQSLYERTQWRPVTERRTIMKMDADGHPVVDRIESVDKYIQPDTMAIIYWLNNRSRATGEWAQSQNVKLSGSISGVNLSGLTEDELKNLAKLGGESDGED